MIDRVSSNKIRSQELGGSYKMRTVTLEPHADIGPYRNGDNWRMWIRISGKMAYICLSGDEFRIRNTSDEDVTLMEIKGNSNHTFDEFCEFFSELGFSSINQVSRNQQLIIQ